MVRSQKKKILEISAFKYVSNMFVVGYWSWRNIIEDPLTEDPHHYLCSSNLSMFISSCYNWLASKTWEEWPLKVAELHIICGFSINATADCTFLKTWDRYASAFLLGGFNQSSILNPNHQSHICTHRPISYKYLHIYCKIDLQIKVF